MVLSDLDPGSAVHQKQHEGRVDVRGLQSSPQHPHSPVHEAVWLPVAGIDIAQSVLKA